VQAAVRKAHSKHNAMRAFCSTLQTLLQGKATSGQVHTLSDYYNISGLFVPYITIRSLTYVRFSCALQLEHLTFKLLTRGAGAQFLLSLPHGAFNFATLETIKGLTTQYMPGAIGPAFDFLSSTIATTVCSVISTPQMVLTTRLMAGMYPNLVNVSHLIIALLFLFVCCLAMTVL
jgi:hypothetical protein